MSGRRRAKMARRRTIGSRRSVVRPGPIIRCGVQYYHHKFLRQQPKLNWHNPEAREAALACWTAGSSAASTVSVSMSPMPSFTTRRLRDNQPVPEAARTARHWSHAANLQIHATIAISKPILRHSNEIRRRVERFPDRFVMGEFSEEPARSGGLLRPTMGFIQDTASRSCSRTNSSPSFIRTHYEELATSRALAFDRVLQSRRCPHSDAASAARTRRPNSRGSCSRC